MADEQALHAVLRQFARTMTGRYDLTDVLYELCDGVVEVLRATGAGVALCAEDGELRFVTATNQDVVSVERAQERLEKGPCYASVEKDGPVVVSDVREHTEWPEYREVAEARGLLAVVGFPLVLDDDHIGSLDVYNAEPRIWTDGQINAAEVLADVATAYILNASELARARRTAEQLQTALDSRVVIEQAKGRLAGEQDVSVDEAFARLRRHARSRRLTLRELAQTVVDHGAAGLEDLRPA